MLAETGLVGREVGEDVLVETGVDDFFLDFWGYAKKGDGAIVWRGGFGTFFVDRRYIQWRPSSLGLGGLALDVALQCFGGFWQCCVASRRRVRLQCCQYVFTGEVSPGGGRVRSWVVLSSAFRASTCFWSHRHTDRLDWVLEFGTWWLVSSRYIFPSM